MHVMRALADMRTLQYKTVKRIAKNKSRKWAQSMKEGKSRKCYSRLRPLRNILFFIFLLFALFLLHKKPKEFHDIQLNEPSISATQWILIVVLRFDLSNADIIALGNGNKKELYLIGQVLEESK